MRIARTGQSTRKDIGPTPDTGLARVLDIHRIPDRVHAPVFTNGVLERTTSTLPVRSRHRRDIVADTLLMPIAGVVRKALDAFSCELCFADTKADLRLRNGFFASLLAIHAQGACEKQQQAQRGSARRGGGRLSPQLY